MKLEFTPDLSHSEMRAVRRTFCGTTFEHIFSLPFLNTSVAAFRGFNPTEEMECVLRPRGIVREIIAQEASHSHAAFINIRSDASSEGERCMKDTHYPIRHPRIFGRARSRRSCACHDDQFGRGQNTGLGGGGGGGGGGRGGRRPHFCVLSRSQSNS